MAFVSDRTGLQQAGVAAFRRWPRLRRAGMAVLDGISRVALLPFRRRRRRGAARERADLVASTDDFNAAAERYYTAFPTPEFLLNKPFSDPSATAKHLIDAGMLMQAMRLVPGDRVAELGAGSCWLSHLLNRFGCRTIALDVSPTALALGRTLFERDSATNWALDPQFLAYDGRRLPLDTASCDRIVINDAFHHIPNQRELLREMHRVLVPDGVVAMSEPGLGHAVAEQSLAEAATGVLENEIDLADLDALARDCGFTQLSVLAASPLAAQEIPVSALGAFMGGRGFAEYWKMFCGSLERHHYIVIHKGSPQATTRRPNRLEAAISPDRGAVNSKVGEATHLNVRVTNTGDTRWLATGGVGKGWTRLGVHLYSSGSPPQLVNFDYARAELPSDVSPEATVSVSLMLPAVPAAGDYVVVLDLVIEGLTWFAERGSPTATVRLGVRS